VNEKYIKQAEWIERLEEELSTCKDEKRKIYLKTWINAVFCRPTVNEKEIIRKAFERVIEQLNGLMPIQFNGFGKTLITVEDVIKILKEECGINE
jgi:hypothetical protein